VPFRWSLRFRLSLIITLLIAAVLVAFLWAVNQEGRRAVLQNGADRAMVAATQVANMLAQTTSRGFAELQHRAAEPGLSDFLASPSDALRARIEQRLKSLATQGQPALVVLSADGTRLLEVRNEPTAAGPPRRCRSYRANPRTRASARSSPRPASSIPTWWPRFTNPAPAKLAAVKPATPWAIWSCGV
jgi:hypothetical protein